jgi:Tfp pilus assembly protein PilX
MNRHPQVRRRGAVAVIAMIYLTLLATLALAMYAMSSINVETANNLDSAENARTIAESGLRWMQYRFVNMTRPKTTIGNITSSVANSLWPAIRTAITNDLAGMLNASERPVTFANNVLKTSPIAVDDTAARFVISITQDPADARYLIVTSTGTYRGATRSVSMSFKIDKKINYAVAGKVPIQLGRNVMVEGSVVMTTTVKPSNQPPVLAISDFKNINSDITPQITAFQNLLKSAYSGYDNRIPTSDADLCATAAAAGFTDRNGDGFIDEYDVFLKVFDKNTDRIVTASEFTNPSTGKLYDDNLMTTIDTLGAPLSSTDPTRAGYNDGQIDNRDGYAKVSGQVLITETLDSLKTRLAAAGKSFEDVVQGPIIPPNAGDAPVVFGYTAPDVSQLAPANFNTNSFRSQTGPEYGSTTKTSTVITNAVLSVSDANGGTAIERTPYGSTSYQATYSRPVFRNMTFKNCRIPKGLNALFDNCKFQGVTYVETEPNVTNSSGQTTTSASDGMTWSQKMKSGSFSSSTTLTSTNSWGYVRGNNLRFNNCDIEGPIASGGTAGEAPSAYTHFANSWEFTGSTVFNNQADQTATIVCPQTNIEMGSFTNPSQAPSTLIGVVVAGNIDIRGTSVVDGSIIITGDGAGNTTLGWFGPSDGDTNPSSPMPEGGWGKINIRCNPNRALPDGINIPIEILPVTDSYEEGQ